MVRRYLILLMILALTASITSPTVAANLIGSLQSDYYMYQDAGKVDRSVFVQSITGELTKPLFRANGWKVSFSGDLRDSNVPVKGIEDARITSLIFTKSIIRDHVDVRAGRFLARAGGFSPIDGLEISLPKMPVKATVAYGMEHYAFYRIDASDLPERVRAGVLLEGVIPKGPTWKIDHVTRFKSGDVDDQLTTLGLRCRRFAKFGWDARVGYDSKESVIRDFMYGIMYKPVKDLQINIRYSERRYRIYQDSFFARFEVAPTKLAGLTARYHLSAADLWLGLGVNHRIREDGDLDRIFVSVANDMGELGVRMQTGDNMGQIGGWFNAGGALIQRLTWGVSVNFDRWDSAWNAESTEEWANSLTLGYAATSIFDLEGRVEQYRTGDLDSDIRGLLTFKMRYGL